MQAGIVASLDALVKEFVSASNDERKQVLSRIEEEVEKLTGSAARYCFCFRHRTNNWLNSKETNRF